DDQGGVGGDVLEDFDAHPLGADEAVADGRVGLEGSLHLSPGGADRLVEDALQLLLEGPGGQVRALAGVPAGDEVDGVLGGGGGRPQGGQLIRGGHGSPGSWWAAWLSAERDRRGCAGRRRSPDGSPSRRSSA